MSGTFHSECFQRSRGAMPHIVIKSKTARSRSSSFAREKQPLTRLSNISAMTRLIKPSTNSQRATIQARKFQEEVLYPQVQRFLYEGTLGSSSGTTSTGSKCESEEMKPHIVDLCEEDKRRIIHLVDKLANCKEEKLELYHQVTKLKAELEKREQHAVKLETVHKEEHQKLTKEMEDLQAKLKEITFEKEHINENVQIQFQMLDNKVKEQEAIIKFLKTDKKKMHDNIHQNHHQLEIAISTIDRLNEKLLLTMKQKRDESSQAPEQVVKISDNSSMELLNISKSKSGVTLLEVSSSESSGSKLTKIVPQGQEHSLISELFFMSAAIPVQMEPMFFVKPPSARQSRLELLEEPFP